MATRRVDFRKQADGLAAIAQALLGKTAATKPAQIMTDASDTLPDDIDPLQALILAERAGHAAVISERDKLAARKERLEAIIKETRRAHFGRKSERITDDQLALALEELGASLAKAEAAEEKANYHCTGYADTCRGDTGLLSAQICSGRNHRSEVYRTARSVKI